MPSTRNTAKRRVLLTVEPGVDSHLRAIVPIAHTFVRLGHEVLVGTPANLARLTTTTYKLPHVSTGENWATPEVAHRLADVLVRRGNGAFCRAILTEYLAGPPALRKAQGVIAVAKEWCPDVVVRGCTDLGAYLGAQHLGIPSVSVDDGFTRILTTQRDLLADRMAAHGARLGLDAEASMPQDEITLTPAPRALFLHDLDDLAIADHRPVQPERNGEQLPDWVAQFPDGLPLVYVTLGSIITCAPGLSDLAVTLYRRIIEALTRVQCAAIVSVGRDNVHALRTSAPHIVVTSDTPQPLLARAGVGLVIFHGGFGTFRDCVPEGIPAITIPICSDQPLNAHLAAEAGIGIPLTTDATVDDIAAAITAGLEDTRYRDAAVRWKRRTLTLPPLESALNRVITKVTDPDPRPQEAVEAR